MSSDDVANTTVVAISKWEVEFYLDKQRDPSDISVLSL